MCKRVTMFVGVPKARVSLIIALVYPLAAVAVSPDVFFSMVLQAQAFIFLPRLARSG